MFSEYLPATTEAVTSRVQKLQNLRCKLQIQPVTLQELEDEISNNLNAKKAPGYDLITAQVLKQLSGKGIRKLINAAFRM